MKIFSIIPIFFLYFHSVSAQELVVDPGSSAAIAVNASIINSQLNSTNNQLNLIQKGQLAVSGQLVIVNKMQAKIYQGLSQVASVINNLTTIKEIYACGTDIISDVEQSLVLAKSDPVSGNRTAMLTFTDLEDENLKIASIDAKISLRAGPDGKTELLLHPIYLRPEIPEFLDETDAEQLKSGEVANLLKVITDEAGNKKELLVEYDAETREFIVSDTEKIIVPEAVNNEKLDAGQKSRYRKGKEVELEEGTIFQYAAKEAEGIRSNRLALVASILVDGGISYLVYKGLHALFGKEEQEKEAELLSAGYQQAMEDLENQRSPNLNRFEGANLKQKR